MPRCAFLKSFALALTLGVFLLPSPSLPFSPVPFSGSSGSSRAPFGLNLEWRLSAFGPEGEYKGDGEFFNSSVASASSLTDSSLTADLHAAIEALKANVGVNGGGGRLSGNITTSDKDIHSSLTNKMFKSPNAVRRYSEGPDSTFSSSSSSSSSSSPPSKTPNPPTITKPSPHLTPTDVAVALLDALSHVDFPEVNSGVETLYSFLSPAASLDQDPADYREYIEGAGNKYAVLLYHSDRAFTSPVKLSLDKEKAMLAVKLKDGRTFGWCTISFSMSKRVERGRGGYGRDGEACWMLDSMLVHK